jgi:peptide-methionine (S)-S-oxide reductase
MVRVVVICRTPPSLRQSTSSRLTAPPALFLSPRRHDRNDRYAKNFQEDWNTKGDGAVLATAVGFMGPPGVKPDPTYREVCSGTTGHVEVCQIRYDASKTSAEDLMCHLFTFHDPTTANRQGNDSGTQYASVIFVHDEEQRKVAEKTVKKVQSALEKGKITPYMYATKKVTTKIEDATTFYPADEAHQKYLEKKPAGYCNHRRRFKWEDVFGSDGEL